MGPTLSTVNRLTANYRFEPVGSVVDIVDIDFKPTG